MKSIKLLLLSMTFVIPAVATDKVFADKSMQKIQKAVVDVIKNCHTNDGKHELRMNALKDSTYNMSAIDNKRVLELYADSAQWKAFQYQCNDCTDIDLFIHASVCFFSKVIEAGRGDMSVKDLRNEYMKSTGQ
jgi:hypothetical protein